jgi:hypothetical protein
LRAGFLDVCGVPGVLGPHLFQLLAAGGADLHESRRSLQLLVRRLELCLHRHVSGPRLGQLGAVDLRKRLTAAHPIAERGQQAGDAPSDQGCDDQMTIRVRFHAAGHADAIGRRAGANRLHLEVRTLRELRCNADRHVRQ